MLPDKKYAIPIEADLLILSFLGHFAWELLQAPLFSSLNYVDHFTGIVICLRATLGDIVIALGAFWSAAWFASSRKWANQPTFHTFSIYLVFGLLSTYILEFVNVELLHRWSYGDNMPRVPVLGTGLAPIAQWMTIPIIVLWYLKRLKHNN